MKMTIRFCGQNDQECCQPGSKCDKGLTCEGQQISSHGAITNPGRCMNNVNPEPSDPPEKNPTPQCTGDYCAKWCNVSGIWGCGIAKAPNVPMCDCSGCNGCPTAKLEDCGNTDQPCCIISDGSGICIDGMSHCDLFEDHKNFPGMCVKGYFSIETGEMKKDYTSCIAGPNLFHIDAWKDTCIRCVADELALGSPNGFKKSNRCTKMIKDFDDAEVAGAIGSVAIILAGCVDDPPACASLATAIRNVVRTARLDNTEITFDTVETIIRGSEQFGNPTRVGAPPDWIGNPMPEPGPF